MHRYRLTVEYLGTRFRGWQAQKNARSVQGEMLRAARAAFGPQADVQGAGRTDAGVHALGQVAHIDLPGRENEERLPRALNDLLPQDVNVIEARSCPPRFHARLNAAGRSYLYQISRRRTALGKNLVWWVKDRLDFAAMRGAASHLEGMHDFGNFADRRLEKGKSTMVLLQEAALAEAGDLILVRLRASHFLWRMARRIVGVLVQVGRGELPPAQLRALLETVSDYAAGHTAPPSGLFLEEVLYPGESWRRPLRPVLEVVSR